MKKHISPSNNFKNLNLIINSDNYKLAHEDIGLLSRNEMRGVRMLLEITKPDLILEENKILSTTSFLSLWISITAKPSDNDVANSKLSANLDLMSSLITSLSTTTSILCFKFFFRI